MENLSLVFFLLLSIVLIILGGIVSASADKTDPSSRDNVKKSGTGVWVIGLIFFVFSAFPLGMFLYKNMSNSSSF